MKFVVFLFVVVIFSCVDAYKTRFNHVDIDAILRNERLINVYLKCVLEGKGCTAEGLELKSKTIYDKYSSGIPKKNTYYILNPTSYFLLLNNRIIIDSLNIKLFLEFYMQQSFYI